MLGYYHAYAANHEYVRNTSYTEEFYQKDQYRFYQKVKADLYNECFGFATAEFWILLWHHVWVNISTSIKRLE